VIFGVAVLFAALALLFLLRQPEPRMKPASQASLRELTLVPFGNRNFMRLTFFFSYWSVVTAIASPFYVVHMLKNLNMGYSHIAVYAVIAGVVTLVAQPVWGRVADRVGNRPVVLVNLLGIVILPLFWLFATPEFVLPIWGDAFLTGIFWPGLSLASFNLLLVACPEEARASYIAIFSAFSGVGTFLSALIGGALASVFSGFHLDVFGLSLINFHLLFIITSLGRLSAVIPLRTIQEPRAERVSVMLEWMSEALVKRLTLGRDTWMVVRRRQ
jgi:MFS family permease